ncbi:MAG: 2-keto-4-pentenoate hydratase [Bacteriovoracia bacterium]
MTVPAPENLAHLAAALYRARRERKPCPPLTQTAPGLTLADAYRISEINHFERLKEPGVKPVGKKIGLTSKAVQKQLSVYEPDYGYLTSDMLVMDGATAPIGELIQPRAEGEVAFVLKTDLIGPGITSQQVAAAIDHAVVCIEIIDSRVADWKIKIQDTIADNASSAMFVLGARKIPVKDIDLRLAGMTLWKNGEVESSGCGAACLNHPFNAVAWLANAMAKHAVPLRAGDILLSGAYGPVVPVKAGDQVEVEIKGLGRVSCRFQ